MAEYVITRNDGKFKVQAGDVDEANKLVDKLILDEKVAKSQASRAEMPMWAKPFAVADDVAMVGADAATLGTVPYALDKMFGGDRQGDVAVARQNLGNWQYPVEIGAGLASPYSLGAKAAKFVGGSPMIRGLVGAGASALEGGAQGAVEAVTKGEDIPAGVLTGLAAGGAGHGLSHIVGGAANKGVKWWKGVDDSLKPPSKSPVGIPAPARELEEKLADAANKPDGLTQKRMQNAASVVEKKRWSPEAKDAANTVVHGDKGTNWAKAGGNWLDKLSSMIGAGAGLSAGDLTTALVTGGGAKATAEILRRSSANATAEQMEQLRRLLLKKPEYQGVIGPLGKERMSQGVRRGVDQYLEDY